VKKLLAATVLAMGMTGAASSWAVEVYSNAESGASLQVGVLVQPWVQATAPEESNQGSRGIGAPSGQDGRATGPSYDLFLRRARLLVHGSANEELSFFFQTDQPNWGKGGSFKGASSNFSSPLYVQDAFMSYAFLPELTLDFGMMAVPFTRHALESASSLHTLDQHAEMLRLPTGKHARDTGLQARGLLTRWVHYRVGIFQGVRNAATLETPVEPVGASYPDLNPDGLPRFTGQLRFNLLGAEPDFFFKGVAFSKEPLVSMGLSGDYQDKAVLKLNTNPGAYRALAVDFASELPVFADSAVITKAQLAWYGKGWSRVEESLALETGGVTFFGEVGYRYGQIEPLVYVEYLRAGSSSIIPITTRPHASIATHAGLNYWVEQHRFNLKLDAGYRQLQQENRGNMVLRPVEYTDLFATLQAQLSL
jgi:hypothetical protein